MSSFLQETVVDLLNKYGENLSRCAVVFPSRRAGVFFRDHLHKSAPKVMWSPKILTIGELMQEFSSLQAADSLSLVFDLYRVYLEEKKSSEPFDDFYFWGTVMLNDFEEIDKYRINARALFTNLAQNRNMAMQFDFLDEEQKALIGKFWDSFSAGSLSGQQQVFLRNWDILFPVYEKFRENLKAESRGYEGMIYREVADLCDRGEVKDSPYEKIVFVGFNALNQCERVFFRWLHNAKRADFYWDTDPWYMNNPVHEAGRFLRENIAEFGGWKREESSLTGDKQIRFVSVSSNVSQAKLTGQLLEELDKGLEETGIAVVLPDEDLLVPVLSAIPEKYKQVNVTMGLTLRDSPVYDLIQQMVLLQSGARMVKNEPAFYHKHVLDLLENPVLAGACSLAAERSSDIRKNNRMLVPAGFFAGDELLKDIFIKTGDGLDLCAWLLGVLQKLSEGPLKDEEDSPGQMLQREFLYYAFLAMRRLLDLLQEKKVDVQSTTLARMLKKVLADVEVPFRGEPLAGIQVMGVLETRLLDFDRIILLSMNEGIFPKKSSTISFIPQTLRRGFGLPSIGHQDAIYSYYFFRLIQRAQQVTCVYNIQSGGMQSGEPSRFIHQLNYSGKFNIEHSNLLVNATMAKVRPIIIQKSTAIMESLQSFIANEDEQEGRYLSPSAINTWLQCRLKFYFRVVVALREPDELSEEVDPRMLGNLLHKSAEMLYRKMEGKTLGSSDFKVLSEEKLLRELVKRAFDEVYFKGAGQELQGRNLIVADILHSYLAQILKVDAGVEGLKILGLEKKVTGTVESGNLSESEERGERREESGKIRVRIGGVIDRLDETNREMRIIDYKTGGDKSTLTKLEVLFEQGNQHGAILQLLIYSLLLEQEQDKPIVPGLYKMQSLFGEDFDPRIKIGKEPFTGNKEILKKVRIGLQQVISDIFNPNIPFDQVNDEKICQYCAYREICFPGRSMMSDSESGSE